jgi:hypothetical protein
MRIRFASYATASFANPATVGVRGGAVRRSRHGDEGIGSSTPFSALSLAPVALALPGARLLNVVAVSALGWFIPRMLDGIWPRGSD